MTVFTDQMNTGTRSGSSPSTGIEAFPGFGCHSGTGSVLSGQFTEIKLARIVFLFTKLNIFSLNVNFRKWHKIDIHV